MQTNDEGRRTNDEGRRTNDERSSFVFGRSSLDASRHSHSLRCFIPCSAEKGKIGEEVEDAPEGAFARKVGEGGAPEPARAAMLAEIYEGRFQVIVADGNILLDARDQIVFERGLRVCVPRAQPAAPQLRGNRKEDVAMDLAMRGRCGEFECDAVRTTRGGRRRMEVIGLKPLGHEFFRAGRACPGMRGAVGDGRADGEGGIAESDFAREVGR